MELETFDITNLITEKNLKPILRITSDGLFSFSTAFCKKLDLKEYSAVKFHRNKESVSDWYVEVVKSDGFVLRKRKNAGLAFASKALVQKVYESLNYNGDSGRMTLGEKVEVEGRTLYTLVTARLKKSFKN